MAELAAEGGARCLNQMDRMRKVQLGRGYRVKQIVPIAGGPTMAGVDATFAGTARLRRTTALTMARSTSMWPSPIPRGPSATGSATARLSASSTWARPRPPSRKTLDRSAELMADIAKRYGWFELVFGGNVGLRRSGTARQAAPPRSTTTTC